jgi:hypothetical protein
VVNTINSALQVHSPSRKTMETGRYTIEGLIEGMERKRNELLLAAERVARDMAESLDPNVDIDSTMEKMTRELERTKQEQHEQLSKLREQAAEDLDRAIRSGASPEAVRQIDEDYARLIGTMAVEQNKTISELSKAQERQLNLLREQKAHAEQAIREGRSLNGETRRAAEEISKSIATDTSDNDYSGPFDVRALDESAAEYVETYAVALNKIEQMAYEHHVRMSNIGTAYGFGGLAASANQVDLSGFATSVTNALTTAIGNMRVTCGTTIVVENMTVREEADIRRISRELNRMMEHSANARGGAR